MNPTLKLCLLALGILLSACSGTPTPAPTAAALPTAAPTAIPATAVPANTGTTVGGSKTLHLEIPVDATISDIPRLMAADSLRTMGYDVQGIDLHDNTLSAQAIEQGSLDIALISNPIALGAVQHGAKLVSIVDDSSEQRVFVVTSKVNSCADLAGKRLAVPSTTSTQMVMLNRYIDKECPGTTYTQVAMPNVQVRLQGLMAGQLDGGTADLPTFQQLQRAQHPDLHILVNFAQEFPGLRGSVYITRRELVAKNPQAVKDFVRTLLLARRQLQDPNFLQQQVVKYLKMSDADAKQAAADAIQEKIWDLNGGLTNESVQANLDFLTQANVLKPGLQVSDVADLTPLMQVLDEIGRK